MVNGNLLGDGFVNGTWFCESMEFELVYVWLLKDCYLIFA